MALSRCRASRTSLMKPREWRHCLTPWGLVTRTLLRGEARESLLCIRPLLCLPSGLVPFRSRRVPMRRGSPPLTPPSRAGHTSTAPSHQRRRSVGAHQH